MEQLLLVVLLMEILAARLFMEWLLLAVALLVVQHQPHLPHLLLAVEAAVVMLIQILLAQVLHQALVTRVLLRLALEQVLVMAVAVGLAITE